jgi:hypothetical protein
MGFSLLSRFKKKRLKTIMMTALKKLKGSMQSPMRGQKIAL